MIERNRGELAAFLPFSAAKLKSTGKEMSDAPSNRRQCGLEQGSGTNRVARAERLRNVAPATRISDTDL
ncbi:hypothetical protein [Primorskyibacter sp. 2E107]|uniref:hypothetical protein n=1 Tax=Primorskyibacter sp. 2E107 TaxID=3403458 RepID=UPI003AF7F3A0